MLLRPAKLRRMFAAAGFTDVFTRTIISVPPSGRVLTTMDSLLAICLSGSVLSRRYKGAPIGVSATLRRCVVKAPMMTEQRQCMRKYRQRRLAFIAACCSENGRCKLRRHHSITEANARE